MNITVFLTGMAALIAILLWAWAEYEMSSWTFAETSCAVLIVLLGVFVEAGVLATLENQRKERLRDTCSELSEAIFTRYEESVPFVTCYYESAEPIVYRMVMEIQ